MANFSGCVAFQNATLPLGGSDAEGMCWTAEGVAQWWDPCRP